MSKNFEILVLRTRFRLEGRTTHWLRGNLGRKLRGILGHALKDSFCTWGPMACGQCPGAIKKDCGYFHLFEFTSPERQSTGLLYPPPAYLIQTDLPTRLEPGQILRARFLLLKNDWDLVPRFITALGALERYPLAKKLRPRLLDIYQGSQLLKNNQRDLLFKARFTPWPDWLPAPPRGLPTVLHFQTRTPLQLVRRGKTLTEIRAADLLLAAGVRYQVLTDQPGGDTRFFGNADSITNIDFTPDTVRGYSNRQKRPQIINGHQGGFQVEVRDQAAWQAWLFIALFGMGKKTSMGFGQFEARYSSGPLAHCHFPVPPGWSEN